jgi:hypothetical protein
MFVSLNTSKSKLLTDAKITIVNTELNGKDNVDNAISLFCGIVSNFSKDIIIGILTNDHFGANLAQLLNNIEVNAVYISYYELYNNKNMFDFTTHNIRTIWRSKWLQSADKFVVLYHLNKKQFIDWLNGESNDNIENIVKDFIKNGVTKDKTEIINMSDCELHEFYKANWKYTQAEFCRKYGAVNPKNFSRWLNGKNPKNIASRNAVLKFVNEHK